MPTTDGFSNGVHSMRFICKLALIASAWERRQSPQGSSQVSDVLRKCFVEFVQKLKRKELKARLRKLIPHRLNLLSRIDVKCRAIICRFHGPGTCALQAARVHFCA